MKRHHLSTAFLILVFLMAPHPVLAADTGAQPLTPKEKLKLGLLARQQEMPLVVFNRALANYDSLLGNGQTSSRCFMAADLTSEQPQAWRLCSHPEKVEKMPLQVGSGENARCSRHIFKNKECMKFFGNRKNYCLPSGGNYVTQDVYSGRPNQSPFVALKGLDEGLNDNSAGGVGLQQVGRDGKIAWDPRSQSIFALPAVKDSHLSVQDLGARQSSGGGTSLYIYPAREDIQRFRETGAADYWNPECAAKIGKPGWLGDKKASDTPSPDEVSDVSMPVQLKSQSKVQSGAR